MAQTGRSSLPIQRPQHAAGPASVSCDLPPSRFVITAARYAAKCSARRSAVHSPPRPGLVSLFFPDPHGGISRATVHGFPHHAVHDDRRPNHDEPAHHCRRRALAPHTSRYNRTSTGDSSRLSRTAAASRTGTHSMQSSHGKVARVAHADQATRRHRLSRCRAHGHLALRQSPQTRGTQEHRRRLETPTRNLLARVSIGDLNLGLIGSVPNRTRCLTPVTGDLPVAVYDLLRPRAGLLEAAHSHTLDTRRSSRGAIGVSTREVALTIL